MSICFKCVKEETCLLKGVKEHCNDVEVKESVFSNVLKMLRESQDNNSKILKLLDEMELQHDKLIIENEELKSKKFLRDIKKYPLTGYVGEWYKAEDVEAAAKGSIFTLETLRAQFEKNFNNLNLSMTADNKIYQHHSTRIKWIAYYRCAVNNGLVK